MKRTPPIRLVLGLLGIAWLAAAGTAVAADVVVLKGGERIELKEPPVQKGNNALFTRADGTLFSVPMTEVDWKATNALKGRKAEPAKPVIVAPPSTPADAVRTGQQEKARVRVTDADVGHQAEAPAEPGQDKKPSQMPAGAPRVEVLDYAQTKNGDDLIVTGQLQNPGTMPTTNVRLSVTANGADAKAIATATATLSSGTIEGGRTVSFSASLPVGERPVANLKFAPQWWSPTPPPPAASPSGSTAPAAGSPAAAAATTAAGSPAATAAGAASSAPAAGSKPPAPVPTPYGQGMLYAAPAASPPSEAPADGKTGYIPGASTPDNQPKTPQ